MRSLFPVGPQRNRFATLRLALATALVAIPLGATGCRTVGTAVGTAGEVAGDTAKAAGSLVGTAARGAGRIVERTANAAADEVE